MNKFDKRKYIIGSIFLLVVLIFTGRLFFLQVVDMTYKVNAERNAIRRIVNYPARGLIYDRNGNLLVHNKAAYDLYVIPNEMREFDTLEFCRIIQIEKKELLDGINKAKSYSRFKESVVVRQLSQEVYAGVQEMMYKYPGFFVKTRTLREYPHNIAAHMLGYVGEVDRNVINRDSYYELGDYIGVTGLESIYEAELRGKKGVSFRLVDVHNREMGPYQNGGRDTTAVLGRNLITTIDSELQAYAQLLMTNKIGAVVAIEPKTGEVLCYLSSPSYDPNLLAGGRDRGANYAILANDTLKPLTNNAIAGRYSPGSTMKMMNALVALQENAITENTFFHCDGPGSTPITCTHYHSSPLQLKAAIMESCNPFFWNVFRSTISKHPNVKEGYTAWRNHLLSFGLSRTLGSDFYGQLPGSIPDSSHYDKDHPVRWNALTVRSLAIGQGELVLTPLQMANAVAIIANRGYYIEPHLVKAIEDIDKTRKEQTFEKKWVTVDPKYFEPVIEGMQLVIEQKNRYNTHIEGTIFGGKTGTIQNTLGSNHSAFVCFAPKDDPKIAVAVYIQFGLSGASHAAPIASLIVEKYLNGPIDAPHRKDIEKRMIEKNLLNPIQSRY